MWVGNESRWTEPIFQKKITEKSLLKAGNFKNEHENQEIGCEYQSMDIRYVQIESLQTKKQIEGLNILIGIRLMTV